jgi:hypothetical protein
MCGMWDDLLLWEGMSEGRLETAQATVQDGKVIFKGAFLCFFNFGFEIGGLTSVWHISSWAINFCLA